jgi:solute carrier family 25 (adenine nucleotide translocator) protein 4/5/6/31
MAEAPPGASSSPPLGQEGAAAARPTKAGPSKAAKPKLSFAEQFFISGFAAAVSKTAAAPIERVKLLLQSEVEVARQGGRKYASSMECALHLIRSDGVLSLWRGNWATVLRYFPVQAANFPVQAVVRDRLDVPREAGFLKFFAANTLSGSAAGAVSLVFVHPLDYVRTRLANDRTRFTGMRDVFQQTWRVDGLAGLYRGFWLSLVGIVVYRGLYFGLYETWKPLLPDVPYGTHVLKLLLGWAATVSAGFASYPLDTIRRRMMMRSGEPQKYASSWDCARTIVRHEGPQALYRGTMVNIFRGLAGAGALAGTDMLRPLYAEWRYGPPRTSPAER